MSLAMATHLNGQQDTLSDIDKNTSEANEKALLLTIHTAKMTQRYRGKIQIQIHPSIYELTLISSFFVLFFSLIPHLNFLIW